MSFSSGQFVCYFQFHSNQSAKPEYVRDLSNNHLLTDNKQLARQIARIRVGDQIRLTGHLVEYEHNHGFAFHRGTSVSRDDTGNGACETIFVRDVSLLRPAPRWPRVFFWLGAALLIIGLVIWFIRPFRADD